MPEVKPLPATIYHPDLSLENVLSPPYDVISPEEKELYRKASEKNIVRIILPESAPEAGDLFRQWVSEGTLVDEEEPSFFWCEQEYRWQDKTRKSGGLIGLLRLEEPGKCGILPHEDTIPRVRKGQLEWLRAVRANAAPVMILYRDRMKTVESVVSGELSAREPYRTYRDREGVIYRLWKVPPAPALSELFSGRGVFIADGHHRYASSLQYAGESGQEGSAHIMAYFLNSANQSLQVLPFHRCLPGAGKKDLEKLKKHLALDALEDLPALYDALREGLICVAFGGERYSFRFPGDAGPAVHYLHRQVMEGLLDWEENNLDYQRDAGQADKFALDGTGLVFFLPPVPASLLHDIWKKGMVLPRKSTCFHPKIPSGLLMYRHERRA